MPSEPWDGVGSAGSDTSSIVTRIVALPPGPARWAFLRRSERRALRDPNGVASSSPA